MRPRISARPALLFAFVVGGCRPASGAGADALDAARQFYVWYLAPTDSAGAAGSLERALGRRPEAFGVGLRSALEADLEASKADSDYVVGLDFDPFTASQDPCERYVPDSATVRANTVRVSVVEHCSNTPSRGTPLTLEMSIEDKAWRIVDIDFKDGGRLTEILARLKAARDSSRAPTA